ncbi:MAG: mechanosensitive ion channel, partial [Deltaproteobacteria bacterium]|nr:mechanosensitive ion channel [Deltaproteobacteria bacterium]
LRTLGIVTDGASLCLFAAIFLVVWRVLDTPREAIAFLLDLGVAWGTQRFTVGLALAALAALYLSLTVSRVVQALLEGQVYPQRGVDRGAQISINRLISYAFVFVGGVVALEVLGIELGKLAVLAGALGVGIGFGLQGIVNNFVGGLILLSERPIKVGDLLQLGTEWGKVTRLGLRATTIQTFDRSEIIVPNAELVSGRVVNWTHSDRAARLVVPVGVAYGSDVAEVMRILEESAAEHPKIARDPKPQAVFLRFGESSLDFQLMAGVKDVEDRLSIQSWVLQTLERRFREAGIEIPFPQRVIRTVAAEAGPGAGRPAEPPPEGEKREESAGDP